MPLTDINALLLDDRLDMRAGIKEDVLTPIAPNTRLTQDLGDFMETLNELPGRLDLAVLDMKLNETWDTGSFQRREEWVSQAGHWHSRAENASPLKHMLETDGTGIAQLYSGFVGLFAIGAYQQRFPRRLPPIIILYTANMHLRAVLWPFSDELEWAGRPFVLVEKDQNAHQSSISEAETARFVKVLRQAEKERYQSAQWRAYVVTPFHQFLQRLKSKLDAGSLDHEMLSTLATELEKIFDLRCGPDGDGKHLTLGQLFPISFGEFRRQLFKLKNRLAIIDAKAQAQDSAGLEEIAQSGEDLNVLTRECIEVLGKVHYPSILHNLIGTHQAEHYALLHGLLSAKAGWTEAEAHQRHIRAVEDLKQAFEAALPARLYSDMLEDLTQRTRNLKINQLGASLPSEQAAIDLDTLETSIYQFPFHWQCFESPYLSWSPEGERNWVRLCADPWKSDWRRVSLILKSIQSQIPHSQGPVHWLDIQGIDVELSYVDVSLFKTVVERHINEAFGVKRIGEQTTKSAATEVWIRISGEQNGRWTLDVIDAGKGFESQTRLHEIVSRDGKTFQTTRQELAGWADVEVYAKTQHDNLIHKVSLNTLDQPEAATFPNRSGNQIDWDNVGSIIRFTVHPPYMGWDQGDA